MKAIALTSTSPRHRYFLKAMDEAFNLVGAFLEPKKTYYDAQRQESPLVAEHFSRLREVEDFIFPQVDCAVPDSSAVQEVGDINELAWIAEARRLAPDVVLLFGTAILREGWLEAFPGRIINLHLGLSPYYRGSATLFWPFANCELECLGTTIHLAEAKVDAGQILGRIKPDIAAGSDYYAITNSLIRQSIDAMPTIVRDYLEGRRTPRVQEQIEGHCYRKADFNEEALRRALGCVGRGLTEQQISRIKQGTLCHCSP